MMHCWVGGDSIGVGIAAVVGCPSEAKVGISSFAYAATHVRRISADLVVLSLGSNDGDQSDIGALRLERSRLSGQVVWALPAPRFKTARRSVEQVAHENGDRILTFAPGPDGVHPTAAGYQDLAATLQKLPGSQ